MNTRRIKIHIQGAVQGVGFRPFVYRLARRFSLTGWVQNTSRGVFIEADGDEATLMRFLFTLEEEKPPRAVIHSLKHHFLDARGYQQFEIAASDSDGDNSAWILPDIATCRHCLQDVFNPTNRRYLYPFTNCTHCGPRFTIVNKLPYDRQNTTMNIFEMCPACREEYENPADRRFHAQPNACPECGPQVSLRDNNGATSAARHEAIIKSVDVLRQGGILAVKGLGGFHIMADAGNNDAVQLLRQRKNRDEKPFALMFADIAQIEQACFLDEMERRLLQSPEAPILLLQKRREDAAARNAAPNNPQLGVMLPYTPLHHILLRFFKGPLVATSGNLADETICITNDEALQRLNGIVDFFLMHNRPIARHADDSIVRIIADRTVLLRRARGYAPMPISLKEDGSDALAVGGHLKNTIAVKKNGQVFISQHIGDLDTESSLNSFDKTVADFEAMYQATPKTILHDAHPDYMSTQQAQQMPGKKIAVQHHLAHVFSCMADNELEPPLLGVSWDGTGYGDDGTIWGGEFFLVESSGSRRIAHLRTFPLPGGDAAIKQPFRTAIGLLYEIAGDSIKKYQHLPPFQQLSISEKKSLMQMLQKNINCPRTSSVGRLFDAVASLLDIQQHNRYEGQAPMQLEFAALRASDVTSSYPFSVNAADNNHSAWILDWQPMIEAMLDDIAGKVTPEEIAATFHNTLAQMILKTAQHSEQHKIALSGGAFQNKLLVEKTIDLLSQHNIQVYTHQRVPPNDGGISLGQIAAFNYFKSLQKIE